MNLINKDWHIDFFANRSDLNIRYGTKPAQLDKCKSAVLFLNGRSEWIEKYQYLATDLNLPEDIAFLTLDHRGQGDSEGVKSYIGSYDEYIDDIELLLQHTIHDKPYVILAHSTGGLMGLYGTMRGRLQPKAMCITSPLLGMPVPKPLQYPAKLLTGVLKSIGLGSIATGGGDHGKKEFNNNPLTHNPKIFEVIKNTPYPIPSATLGWVRAGFEAIDEVFDPRRLSQLNCDVKLYIAEFETVVDKSAINNWYKKACNHSSRKIEIYEVMKAKHEILCEVDAVYKPVLEDIRKWILSHLRN